MKTEERMKMKMTKNESCQCNVRQDTKWTPKDINKPRTGQQVIKIKTISTYTPMEIKQIRKQ